MCSDEWNGKYGVYGRPCVSEKIDFVLFNIILFINHSVGDYHLMVHIENWTVKAGTRMSVKTNETQ